MNSNLIYETKYWNIFLALDQTYLGRNVIVLKRECGNLSNLQKEEREELQKIVKKVEHSIKESFSAKMFNRTCLMNNAYKEKEPKPQVHRHCKPRYNKEITIENIIFKDLEFGKHYDHKKFREIPDQVRKRIIKKIQENL